VGEVGEELVGGRGREGDGFDEVVVALEGDLEVACLGVPEAGHAVVAGAEEEAAVERGGYTADPFGVAAEGLEAVARGDVPDAQGLVAAGGDEQVAGEGGAGGPRGDEADGGDGVVVARQGADVLVGVRGVPQLDGEVGAAGGEQGAASGPAVVDVQDCSRVAFEGVQSVA